MENDSAIRTSLQLPPSDSQCEAPLNSKSYRQHQLGFKLSSNVVNARALGKKTFQYRSDDGRGVKAQERCPNYQRAAAAMRGVIKRKGPALQSRQPNTHSIFVIKKGY